jgi:hypothetical protein
MSEQHRFHLQTALEGGPMHGRGRDQQAGGDDRRPGAAGEVPDQIPGDRTLRRSSHRQDLNGAEGADPMTESSISRSTLSTPRDN